MISTIPEITILEFDGEITGQLSTDKNVLQGIFVNYLKDTNITKVKDIEPNAELEAVLKANLKRKEAVKAIGISWGTEKSTISNLPENVMEKVLGFLYPSPFAETLALSALKKLSYTSSIRVLPVNQPRNKNII